MKIKLKTIKGDAFDCEVTSDMEVAKVKELAVASEHGVKGGWEVAGLKLIFQGKVLDNSKDLASCESLSRAQSTCLPCAQPRSCVPLTSAGMPPFTRR